MPLYSRGGKSTSASTLDTVSHASVEESKLKQQEACTDE